MGGGERQLQVEHARQYIQLPDGFGALTTKDNQLTIPPALLHEKLSTWELVYRADYSKRRGEIEQKIVSALRLQFTTRTGECRLGLDPQFRKPGKKWFHLLVFTRNEHSEDAIVGIQIDEEYHPEYLGVFVEAMPPIRRRLLRAIREDEAILLPDVPSRIFFRQTHLAESVTVTTAPL